MKAVKKSIPYELWYGFKPWYTHLRIFGCRGFAKIRMTDMKDLFFGLNLYITTVKDKKILSLSQVKYIEKKLQQFNLNHAKPMHTSLEANCNLYCVKEISQEEDNIMKTIPYKFVVGALMYLAITSRSDICYVVSMVAQYNSKSTQNH